MVESVVKLPKDYGMRVPEGIARSGDFDFHYHEGKRYRVIVRFEVKEEIS